MNKNKLFLLILFVLIFTLMSTTIFAQDQKANKMKIEIRDPKGKIVFTKNYYCWNSKCYRRIFGF